MNLIVLFLVSQTLSTSLSTAESFFDLLEQPWLELNTVSLGSQSQERGYMKNCDPNSSYIISWEPKDIDPYGSLAFFVNYTPPADFDSVEYTVDIKYRFIHLRKTVKKTCVEIFGESLLCPAKKGFTIKLKYVPSDIIRFKNFKGTVKLKITAENENHENLLCGTLEAKLF